ncbi:MAG: hypothetical protein EZS28_021618 [Streblomastix strix]|uniref:Uncharacterized protein n=1 Tax=Streblomastix strix TaxID=222440 RepID=A0A5J4VK10_9EUKA|nr:MAG: hypothetical protein EZS28_021618 [Streblomastix strix]
MDIDLKFKKWSLTFKNIKQFTQLRCIADLIIGLHAEPLTESGLKNQVCDIKSVTMSIKNYIITEVTAKVARYKATDACLNIVRQFYSQHLFVFLAQRVEVWPFPTSVTLTGIRASQNILLSHIIDFCLQFPKYARATTCFENPYYQNIQEQQWSIDFRWIRHLELNTFVELRGAPIYQGATNSYYNVDTNAKNTPPPIICTIHDTFWLFSPAAGRNCIYDTNHSFDEVVGSFSSRNN